MGRLIAATAVAAWLLPASVASAATITPDILTDEDAANGSCSLREAVTLANGDHGGSYNGCVAADEDADTVVLQSGATYDLSLLGASDDSNLTGDLDVRSEELTIQSSSASANATISGPDDTNFGRILELGPAAAPAPAVTLTRLTITKGNTGLNQAGGIWASSVGSVTINESLITDNNGSAGAGMRVNAPTTINDSRITANSSGVANGTGGGIWVENGALALNRSSVSGNVSTGVGGGMAVSFGNVTVTNSTFSGNSAIADGGNIWAFGNLNLRSSTIAGGQADTDNAGGHGGGGLFVASGTSSARNTAFANNADVSGGAPDCSGTLTSEGYNLLHEDAGCTIAGTLTGNVLDTDPLLGAFGGNGGLTPTYAHPASGPLEDAGSPDAPGGPAPACPVTDQRGEPRDNVVSRCDIGAYERQPPVLTPVGDKTVQAGQTLAFTAAATDVDAADTLTFSSLNLPPGATFDVDGNFTWTPTEAQIGTFSGAELIVDDGSGSDAELIDITVTAVPPPDPPGTTPPPTTAKKCKKGQKLKKVKGKKKCVKKKRRKRK